jgi:nucleoside-diphosphate-sugar epimerase
MKLAITGGTGFVGGRLLDAAIDAGHQVRALTRRARRPRNHVQWFLGDLDDTDALARLGEGADAVIHVAGLLKARTRAEFDHCNVEGTRHVLAAAKTAGVRRFVHVSSLSAREPRLSMYGASKARSEEVVAESGLAWAIVRPPAVYGPGDKETFELFRMAQRGLIALPPSGRLSLIHADDLARLLIALAEPTAPSGMIVEPDDGRAGGWTHKELARALAQAVGCRSIAISVPGPILRVAAMVDELVRGDEARLTRDRAGYFCHRDWVVDPARSAPAGLWTARSDTDQGLADTAEWYREHRWL